MVPLQRSPFRHQPRNDPPAIPDGSMDLAPVSNPDGQQRFDGIVQAFGQNMQITSVFFSNEGSCTLSPSCFFQSRPSTVTDLMLPSAEGART
jgi:hypothetical protein